MHIQLSKGSLEVTVVKCRGRKPQNILRQARITIEELMDEM